MQSPVSLSSLRLQQSDALKLVLSTSMHCTHIHRTDEYVSTIPFGPWCVSSA
jgi:hypothetical protein